MKKLTIDYVKSVFGFNKEPFGLGVRKYEAPSHVMPKGEKSAIAKDAVATQQYHNINSPEFYSGFLGYPQLSAMTQSSDNRMIPETTANEMTRKWGKVTGEDSEKVELIEQELRRLNVKSLFRTHIYNEHVFGLSHLFIHNDNEDTSLPLIPENIKQGAKLKISLIEPVHTTPSAYNANDATQDDFYKVNNWFVLGQNVHQDRLLTLVMRPVPDILKPAYNFGGTSMIQLMLPYVQRWQRNVDSVSDLIKAFSITCLKTDMGSLLNDGDGDGVAQIKKRLELFDLLRDNMNLMALDGEEELIQINTPLSGLAELVTKSQENMCMPSHTPLVKLTGVTPSGLNSSSEDEIQVYYDWIHSLNEAHILPQIKRLLNIVQMALFGEIDNDISFEFNPLKQMTTKEVSEIENNRANALSTLVNASIISVEEAGESIKNDANLSYKHLDLIEE